MQLLTADQILGADDMAFEDVDVPQWGGTIRVRRLTATERRAFELSTSRDDPDLLAVFVGFCACDAEFKPLFTHEQVKKLAEKDGAAVKQVCKVCERLNKIGEDAEKNSPSPEAGSAS